MSFSGNYRPASFRGIEFSVQEFDTAGGKNLKDNENPSQNPKNLGSGEISRKKKSFKITAFILGEDHQDKAEKLLSALDKDGSGLLIHPVHGRVKCNVESYSLKGGFTSGGKSTFEINFHEAGIFNFPFKKNDNIAQGKETTSLLKAKSVEAFAKKFNVKGVPQFVKNGAIDKVKGLGKAFDDSTYLLSDSSDAMAMASKGALDIQNKAGELINSPLDLGNGLVSNFNLLKNTSVNPRKLFDNYKSLLGGTTDQKKTLPTTTAKTVQRQNEDALEELTKTNIIAVKAESAFEYSEKQSFESLRETTEVRDDILAGIDELLFSPISDDLFESLNELKNLIINILPGENVSIPSVQKIKTDYPTNTILLAHKYYKDATREADIQRRNKILNPMMIPVETEIEVIND